MSAEIEIEFSEGTKQLVKQAPSLPARMMQAIRRGVDKANDLTVSNTQQNRMTGRGPYPVAEGKLGQVSGHLRKSLRRSAAVVNGMEATGTIGTNIVYAGVHEFGFNGQEQVSAFRRKVKSRDQFAKVDRVSKKTGKPYKGKVKTASGITQVKSFTRWMQIEARAPIGHGIADNAGTYDREIGAELRKEWGNKA
jgi:phage gpG-like protein